MNTYILTMSKDGIWIDAETEIKAENEPGFWECYEIADAHGCELWALEEVKQ